MDEEVALGAKGNLSRAEVMGDLYDDVERALVSWNELNERKELDVTTTEVGADGGGGLRVKPPKLSAPPGLQLAALPEQLEGALKQNLAKRFGETGAELLDIEEFGMMLVKEREENVAVPSQAPPIQKKVSSKKVVDDQPKKPAKPSYRVRSETLLAPGWDGGGGLRLDPLKLGPRPKKEIPTGERTEFEVQILSAAAAMQDAPQLYGALLGPEELIKGMLQERERPEHGPGKVVAPHMEQPAQVAHAAVKFKRKSIEPYSPSERAMQASRAQVAPL